MLAAPTTTRLPALAPSALAAAFMKFDEPAPAAGSGDESPYKTNPCKVKTASRRYRNDPYRANVTGVPMKAVQLEPLAIAPALPPVPPRQLPSLTAGSRSNTPPPPPPEKETRGFATHLANQPLQPHPPLDASRSAPHRAPAPIQSHGNSNPTYPQYVLVRFRRSQYTYGSDGSLQEGDVVVIDGDRGAHMGVVVDGNARKPKGYVGPVIRRATEEDVQHFNVVRRDEAAALDVVRQHVAQAGLVEQMTVLDVEWQTDYAKLTIFFSPTEKDTFVDFRGLQRSLYKHFRCRIWLVDF